MKTRFAKWTRKSRRPGAFAFAVSLGLSSLGLTGVGLCKGGAHAKQAEADQSETAQQITFSGFRAAPEGGGTLLVYLTGKPEFELTQNSDHLVIRLLDTGVGVRNNKNPLDLTPFGLPVVRAQLVAHGNVVEWVLTLKSAVKLTPHFADSAAAPAVLVVEIPAGS